MKTSTKPVRIPGKPGPAPNAPKSSMPTGTPGVRGSVAGEWTPLSWNSRRPEQAVRPAPAVPAEGVSAPPLAEDENSGEKKKPKLIDYPDKPKPLDTTDVDHWPEKAR